MVKRFGLRPCLPGFEKINRFHDKESGRIMVKLLPGEFYVCREPEVMVTVLGSCISACLMDLRNGIAGMNHFMLPGQKYEETDVLSRSARYGSWAMEVLLNEMLKAGAVRENIQAKIFGGGRVISSLEYIEIGRQNTEFVVHYLSLEHVPIIAQDTGDIFPRKLQFFSDSGRVRVRKLEMLRNDTVVEREQRYRRQLQQQQDTTSVELFGEEE